jgi:hypothetical protein
MQTKIERAKFICPHCDMDTQRVDCVPGILFACQNCNAPLFVEESGNTVTQYGGALECDCADRSWYGAEHDSACVLAGQPNPNSLLSVPANKNKMTPGPWEARKRANDVWRVHADDTNVVAVFGTTIKGRPDITQLQEQAANAKAIAAVPELIEALHSLQKAIREAHLLNAKKHFSLCVADADAGKALHKAGIES